MKPVSFSLDGRRLAGVLDRGPRPLSDGGGRVASVIEIVDVGTADLAKVRELVGEAPRHPLGDVRIEARIRPGKVLCSGGNFKAHAEENPNAVMLTEPFFFAKLPSSIVGPVAPVAKTDRTEKDGEDGLTNSSSRS